MTLLATDGELSIRKSVKAEIFEEGEICVPGKLFSDFIGKLSGEEVSISTGEKGVELKYRDAGTFMQSLPAEEFPKIDFSVGENSFTMKQADLKKIIAETTFCCAQDDSRPVLKGCLMEFGEKLEMTALDGYRLAIASAPILSKSGDRASSAPQERSRRSPACWKRTGGDHALHAGRHAAGAVGRERPSFPRLYQGDFIRKENVVPSNFTTVVTLVKEELVASVERAAILIRGDKNNLVTLEIGSESVKVSSVSDFGNVAEVVQAQVEGLETTVSMNAKYLLDGLRALGEERVAISFNGPVSPFILQNEGAKDSLYLILPVRNVA